MPELPTVVIHADESCLGNQFVNRANPGGAAGLVETWTDEGWVRRDYWISSPNTTNNQMAIQSAIVPLNALKKACKVEFISDSQYLVKGMSEWIHGWKAKGWKRKTGAIENLELWQELDAAVVRHKLSWRWVRGHAGHAKNEYANYLATTAAKELGSSGGLVESGFVEWLAGERAKRRYLDYVEGKAP
jgi:ribonuclease HI